MLPGEFLGASGPGGPVSEVGCTSCHRSIFDGKVERAGLAIDHDTCIPDAYRCVDCHGDISHPGTPALSKSLDMSTCLECHNGVTLHADCGLCHKEKRNTDLYKSGMWARVHLGEDPGSHGLGNLATCQSCHPGGKKCMTCHSIELPHPESFGLSHGETALAVPDSCETCHDRANCDECHGIAMPHPATFLPDHSAAAVDEQDATCLGCHVQRDCDSCHTEHAHPGRVTGYDGPYY